MLADVLASCFTKETPSSLPSGIFRRGRLFAPNIGASVNEEDVGLMPTSTERLSIPSVNDTGSGVILNRREGWSGLEVGPVEGRLFAPLSFDSCPPMMPVVGGLSSSIGTGTLRDSARAMVIADAVWKRASGS